MSHTTHAAATLLRQIADQIEAGAFSTPAPKAPKAPRVAAVVKADAPAKAHKAVCKANREAFVKQNAWAKGLSTLAICEAMLAGQSVKGAWTVGEKTVARIVTGAWSA